MIYNEDKIEDSNIADHFDFVSQGPEADDVYFNICYINELVYLHKYKINDLEPKCNNFYIHFTYKKLHTNISRFQN